MDGYKQAEIITKRLDKICMGLDDLKGEKKLRSTLDLLNLTRTVRIHCKLIEIKIRESL